jgi:hypothetical protein
VKTLRYTDSQFTPTLARAEAATPVLELCRERGMSFTGGGQNMAAGTPRWLSASKNLRIKVGG